RLFDSGGSPLTGELQASVHDTAGQIDPALSPYGSGDFIVIWDDNFNFGGTYTNGAILARRYSSAGAPVGTEFLASSGGNDPKRPAVAPADSGGFVCAFAKDNVYVQRFTGGAAPNGTELQVS